MTVQTLLSIDVEPLAPGDTVAVALDRLAHTDVEHVPVVDAEGHLVTVLSEADLLAHEGEDLTVGELRGLGPVQVEPDAHWYEAASLLATHRLSALPVVTRAGRYLGLLRRTDVFDRFAGALSTGSHGAVLSLEVLPRDFSMGQLVRLVEESNAKVLSVSTQGQEQAPTLAPVPIQVTLKLNTADTSRVKHVLEHHGYHVTAAFNEEETDESFNTRLAQFLRYLEV